MVPMKGISPEETRQLHLEGALRMKEGKDSRVGRILMRRFYLYSTSGFTPVFFTLDLQSRCNKTLDLQTAAFVICHYSSLT